MLAEKSQSSERLPDQTVSTNQGIQRRKTKPSTKNPSQKLSKSIGSKKMKKDKDGSALGNQDISKDPQRTRPIDSEKMNSTNRITKPSTKDLFEIQSTPDPLDNEPGLVRSDPRDAQSSNDNSIAGLGSIYQAAYTNEKAENDLSVLILDGSSSMQASSPLERTNNLISEGVFAKGWAAVETVSLPSNNEYLPQHVRQSLVDEFEPPPSAQVPPPPSSPLAFETVQHPAEVGDFDDVPDDLFDAIEDIPPIDIEFAMEDQEEIEEIMHSILPKAEPNDLDMEWRLQDPEPIFNTDEPEDYTTKPNEQESQIPTNSITTHNTTPTVKPSDHCYPPTSISFHPSGRPIPFSLPPFPALVPDRSPIPGLTNTTNILTAFRISSAITASRLHKNTDTIIELYARVLSSHREGHKQFFRFGDLFTDKPPFLEGVYCVWKGVDLWDEDCRVFLGEGGKMCRVVGRVERGPGTEGSWEMRVLSVWEVGWGDVGLMKGELCG